MSEWDDVEIEQEELPPGRGPQRPGFWPIAAVVGLVAFCLGLYFFFWKNRSAPEPDAVAEAPAPAPVEFLGEPEPEADIEPAIELRPSAKAMLSSGSWSGSCPPTLSSLRGLSRKTWCEGSR